MASGVPRRRCQRGASASIVRRWAADPGALERDAELGGQRVEERIGDGARGEPRRQRAQGLLDPVELGAERCEEASQEVGVVAAVDRREEALQARRLRFDEEPVHRRGRPAVAAQPDPHHQVAPARRDHGESVVVGSSPPVAGVSGS